MVTLQFTEQQYTAFKKVLRHLEDLADIQCEFCVVYQQIDQLDKKVSQLGKTIGNHEQETITQDLIQLQGLVKELKEKI